MSSWKVFDLKANPELPPEPVAVPQQSTDTAGPPAVLPITPTPNTAKLKEPQFVSPALPRLRGPAPYRPVRPAGTSRVLALATTAETWSVPPHSGRPGSRSLPSRLQTI